MQKKVIIFDATLFVNAYETQLFRTGLFRVSEQLLKQLLLSDRYEIWLYDTMGRDRIMRQQIIPQYPQTHLLSNENGIYSLLTDRVFLWVERLREGQMSCRSKVGKRLCKLSKNALQLYAQVVLKVCKRKPLSLPTNGAHYVATYYPIPNWVHTKHLTATLIVHDLIPLIHPEWFASEANKHTIMAIINSVSPDDWVVCVSESTKRDFLHFCTDFPESHTRVACLAAADVFRPTALSERLCKKLGIQGEYILSVCTIEPRKNLHTVVEAYEKLLTAQSDVPQLILTGAIGWKNSDLLLQIEMLQNVYPGKIILAGYVGDDDLAQLYSGASVFVYPSLYEGFGLPPLEAMQCGCPVITSNVSSLPEVVGDAGVTIDPTDVSGLVEAIADVLAGNREEQKQHTLLRAEEFSWKQFESVIEQTVE